MGAFISGIALKEGKMMKILFILVVLTYLALGEDFSAEDKAEVAVASGGDLLHHSLAKREAGKRKSVKNGKKGQVKKRKGINGQRRRKGKKGGIAKKEGKGRKEGKRGKGRKGGKAGKAGKEEKGKGKKKKPDGSRRKTIKSRNKNTRQDVDYKVCAETMKNFTSRIIRAGNLERQAKRIDSFGDIKASKKDK